MTKHKVSAASMSHFECERRRLHEELCRSEVVTLTDDVVSFSDSNNALSRKISLGICKLLHVAPRTLQKKLSGQTLGERTERCVAEYLRRTFPKLQHLRPGSWTVTQSTRNGIADFEQYEHLSMLQAAARRDAALAVALGNDYIIKPDVLMVRNPEPDSHINAFEYLVDETVATRSALRAANNPTPILHASVSTKLTLRSDRAQNARTESLNLLRNRKGRAPHIVVVTAEPLPSRLASLALGTGDIDCVYHLFLRELIAVVDDLAANSPDAADTKGLLDIMLQGRRLKDVTDLPLDLAV